MGAVAQLGERLLCKQEVTGSIPVSSTTLREKVVASSDRSSQPESKENKQNNLLETGSHASGLEF
jgi:hypothetical protein